MTITYSPSSTTQAVLSNGVTSFTFDSNGIQSGVESPIKSITASITSNAITVTLPATTLDFRSTTLTNGAPTQIQTTSTLSLTIASTDSFGLVTAAGNQRLAILAINNAGTVELAASAIYGGVSLDETGVITTAATATTATAIKAANVRTGVAYRVVGFVDATFTTAVGWGTLALVQGAGGNAATAMGSLGYGQTWQTVTRVFATTYYNNTGKPISLHAAGLVATGGLGAYFTATVSSGGISVTMDAASGPGNGQSAILSIPFIPPGASYSFAIASGTYTSLTVREGR